MCSIAPGASASGLNVPGTVLMLPCERRIVGQQLGEEIGEPVAVRDPRLLAPVGLVDLLLDGTCRGTARRESR